MPETAGATVTVDGITSRPVYSYAPPEVFFSGGAIPPGTAMFNVADYGAVASASVDNRTAIQSAVDAAAAAGGGLVYVPPGTYGITASPAGGNGGIYLKGNVFLIGDGIGQTTLRVMDGWSGPLTGIVRSPPGVEKNNYGVADITLDGNRANATGKVDAFYCGVTPNLTLSDHDVYVLRVEGKDCAGYGFDPHEVTTRLTIANCVAHGNGLDGFVADHIVDGVYKDNVAYGNDRHGFNIVTTSNDMLLTGNIAHDNGSSGFTVQRGSFNIASPGNIVITGGESYGNVNDGILLRMSDNILVTSVNIHDNGQAGVHLKGSSHVTIDGNIMAANSTSKSGGYADIRIENEVDATVALKTYAAQYELISGNAVTASATSPTSYGVEEQAGLVGHSVIADNHFTGQSKGRVLLLGPGDLVAQTGGAGNDTLTAGSGPESISGGAGNDSLTGGPGNDTLGGGDGNDTVVGGTGDDSISGGNGADSLDGGDGNDALSGAAGNDRLNGGAGLNTMRGGDGTDVLTGGADADRLNGDAGNDRLYGNAGADWMLGGVGNDALYGEVGNDKLFGQAGNDTLAGGAGADTLVGGTGADLFLIGAAPGRDVITDFTHGTDHIVLRNAGAHGFADLQLTQSGSGVLVSWGSNQIVVAHMTVHGLIAGDFLFQ